VRGTLGGGLVLVGWDCFGCEVHFLLGLAYVRIDTVDFADRQQKKSNRVHFLPNPLKTLGKIDTKNRRPSWKPGRRQGVDVGLELVSLAE
jgi:hypothetical protein